MYCFSSISKSHKPLPLVQGSGRTVNMFWIQVRPPVGFTCFAFRVPTDSCRPGVSRVRLRVGGLSSRGDRMGQWTSSGLGSSTRWHQTTLKSETNWGWDVLEGRTCRVHAKLYRHISNKCLQFWVIITNLNIWKKVSHSGIMLDYLNV